MDQDWETDMKARCRGSITGWKDLLVAPDLRTMDDEIRRVLPQAAGRQP